jgi:hypothetical protein
VKGDSQVIGFFAVSPVLSRTVIIPSN